MAQSTTDLVKGYLVSHGGSLERFHQIIAQGNQRIGQAFFNSLSGKDQRRIRGTIHDPFYADGARQVLKVKEAIDWLTRNE